MSCAICDRIRNIAHDPAFVFEFAHSYLLLGDHQYFRGYCLLLYKNHVRELHEMDSNHQAAFFGELMLATKAIVTAFSPWKINHACLGNQDQHIHWHIIPRYETEPDHQQQPWLHADQFSAHTIGTQDQLILAEQLYHALQIHFPRK